MTLAELLARYPAWMHAHLKRGREEMAWGGRDDIRAAPLEIQRRMRDRAKQLSKETGIRWKPTLDISRVDGGQCYGVASVERHEEWLGCDGWYYDQETGEMKA
jgi:hypothetical protein